LTKLAAELDLTISAYVDHEVWFNRPPDGPLRSDWLVQTDLAASLQNASEVLEMVVVGENQVQQLRQSLLDRQLAANLNLTVVDQANETLMFIGRIGNDKAVALDWLFRRLGVNWSQVAACGDSSADLEMIRRAGWGLAAPAASEIVRQAHHAPLQLDPNEPIASLVERILQDSKFSDR
jgi:hydroxymethylpyrimidine pyrophosphatase-like HAD family hydrolase